MGRDQRVELDEFLRFQKSARRPERGDDQQRVADFGVGEAMKLARLVERDRDARAPAGLHQAHRRRAAASARASCRRRSTVQVVAVGADAGELRPVELELHHLSVARARDRRVADAAARLRRDLADVDRRRLSNTSQIVSARRNTAAGVGCANGKVMRSASPWRRTSTTTGAAGSAGAGFASSDLARRDRGGRARRFGARLAVARPVRARRRSARCASACRLGAAATRPPLPAGGLRRRGDLRGLAAGAARGRSRGGDRGAARTVRLAPSARDGSAEHRRRNCCPRGTCGHRPCR